MSAATFFSCNEGTADRVIRVVVGMGLIMLAFVGPATPWGFLGAIPLITGVAGVCPLYSILGVRTCPAPRR